MSKRNKKNTTSTVLGESNALTVSLPTIPERGVVMMPNVSSTPANPTINVTSSYSWITYNASTQKINIASNGTGSNRTGSFTISATTIPTTGYEGTASASSAFTFTQEGSSTPPTPTGETITCTWHYNGLQEIRVWTLPWHEDFSGNLWFTWESLVGGYWGPDGGTVYNSQDRMEVGDPSTTQIRDFKLATHPMGYDFNLVESSTPPF